MHKRPELDTINPPGQIINPIPKQECEMTEQARMTTLGHIIDRVRRSDALDNDKLSKETTETVYQRGYADGFLEGKKQGFQEGIAWIKGK